MTPIQNATPWYPMSNVSMDNLTIVLDELMTSELYQETPMDRLDARHYNRPPSEFCTQTLNGLLKQAFQRVAIDTTSAQDLFLLSGMVSWMYRNTDGIVRNALLMMSWFLHELVQNHVPEGKHARPMENKVEVDRVHYSFSGESVNFMANVIRHAVVTVPMEARLPMVQCKSTYSLLSALSSFDKQLTNDSTLIDESQHCLRSVNPSMNLVPATEGAAAREYAIKRLFQTVQVISMIRSEDNFSSLRALMANAQSLIFLARIRGFDDDVRIADTSIILAAVERAVTSHSHTAANLLARAEAGQLVYAEMIKLVKEWHTLVNGDLNTLFGLIANNIKEISESLSSKGNDATMVKAIDDMITRTEIKSTYLMRRSRLPGR